MTKIEAYYGVGDVVANVSNIIVDKFIQNNKIIIPSNCNFNIYFGDPCPGIVKHLILIINNIKHIIREGSIIEELHYDLNDSIVSYPENDIKITIVYYAFINPKSDWINIISGQLRQLKNTGLLNVAEFHTHITGDDIYHGYIKQLIKSIIPKATIYTSNINQYEYPGIHLVWKLAQIKPDNIFLYFHSKGMSYNTPFRRMDEIIIFKSVIEQWKKVWNIFENNSKINKVGGTIAQDGGFCWWNFWWARGSYLIDCEEPVLTTNRFYYESWLRERLPSKTPTTKELRDDKYKHDDCYSLYDDKIGLATNSDIANAKTNILIEKFINIKVEFGN